jgi:hypothetical protein
VILSWRRIRAKALRKLCLALPETTERLSHGEPTWFVRDRRLFVMYANHHPRRSAGVLVPHR